MSLLVPNMNITGGMPAIAMLHVGMVVRLTITVETPEAVTDAAGTGVGIDVHPDDELSAAAELAEPPPPTRTLRKLPLAVIVKLDNVTTEFLPPRFFANTALPERGETALAVTSEKVASP